jgi:hypothetical protein
MDELPLASTALNETVVTPMGNNEPEAGPAVCVTTSPGQLSVAEGAIQLTGALQLPGVLLTVIFPGQDVKTGTCTSVTEILKEHVAVFPLASDATNVTMVTPTGKVEPLGKPLVCVITIPVQLSVAAGAVQLTTAPQTPGVLLMVTFTGHEVNTGSSLSVTVTLNEQIAVFPDASVAA